MPSMLDPYQSFADYHYGPSSASWSNAAQQDEQQTPLPFTQQAPPMQPQQTYGSAQGGGGPLVSGADIAQLGIALHRGGAFDPAYKAIGDFAAPTHSITPPVHTPLATPGGPGGPLTFETAGGVAGTIAAPTTAAGASAPVGAAAALEGAKVGLFTGGEAAAGGAAAAGGTAASTGALASIAPALGPAAAIMLAPAAGEMLKTAVNESPIFGKARSSVGAEPLGAMTETTAPGAALASGATGESVSPISLMKGQYGLEQAIPAAMGQQFTEETLLPMLMAKKPPTLGSINFGGGGFGGGGGFKGGGLGGMFG